MFVPFQTGAPTTRRISLDTIRDRGIVHEAAVRTPMVRLDATAPADRPGPDVFLKLETLQPIGSFKIRGAHNAVRHLTPEQLRAGSGRSAQGMRPRAWRWQRGRPGRGRACS